MANNKGYTCWSELMGNCGHLHKSVEAAEECNHKMTRAVKQGAGNQNNYCNRNIYYVDREDVEQDRYLGDRTPASD